MSAAYALWERGLRTPTFSVIENRGAPPALTERETREKLGSPVALREGDERLPLAVLERLYPCPAQEGEGAR